MIKIFAVILLSLFAANNLWSANLKFSVIDFRGAAEAKKKWKPLSQYLAKKLNRDITLLTSKPQTLQKRAHQFDFILTNPVSTTVIQHHTGHEILATLNSKFTDAEFAGVIITHKDSDIKTLKQLAGKKIGIVDRYNAAGGYMFQAYELLQAGLSPEKDFNNFITLPSQKGIIVNVAKKRIDGGFIRVGMLNELEHLVDPKNINILNKQDYKDTGLARSTAIYPHWAFLAAKNLPAALKEQIKNILLAIKPEEDAAVKADINGFIPAADYSSVLNIMKALKTPPFNQ